MMTMQRLEGFYWVARTGGYARAARAFPYPITQPGVHQQVRRLEDELGVALFERSGKDRVSLTPAGDRLFERVAPFYESLQALEAQLKGGEPEGTLRVFAAGHLLRHLMPPWLLKLQSKFPKVRVALTEVQAADPQVLLRSEAELLIDWLPSLPDGVDARAVAKLHAFVVVPTHGPWALEGRLKPEKLKDVPFIAYQTDRTLKSLQRRALEAAGLAPREAYSADSSDTLLGFVAAGLGFSLVPSLADGGPRVAGVSAHPLRELAPGLEKEASFEIRAAWRKRPAGHPLVDAALGCAPG
jgi:DNA-binding transcriptional LysR family regulator